MFYSFASVSTSRIPYKARRKRLIKQLAALAMSCGVAGAAQGEVTQNVSFVDYQVRHSKGMTLLAALNSASPIREKGEIFHGLTKWQVNWRFWWKQRPDGMCSISNVKATATGTITMPKLLSEDSMAMKTFALFSQALRTHELGHFQHAREAAEQVEKALLAIAPVNDCGLLERLANEEGERIVQDANARDKLYDAITEHGRTQGAWLPR